MKRVFPKNIIFFSVIVFLFLFSLWPYQISGQRELEVKYPEIFGFKPETVETLIPEYVRYIFNFFIAIAGLIGFAILIWAGIRYLTSAGNPKEQKKAKQQIKFAFLGILLLLLSYLILTTINPQLIVLKEPEIAPLPPAPPIEIPISPHPTADLLERIKQLAQATKEVADQIAQTGQEIKSLTENCDCARTQPFCLVRQYRGGACQSQFCYSAAEDQPCPDIKKIRENQQKLVDLRDIILYYKNRSLAEAENLKEDIEKVINVKLKWFEDKIAAEKKVLEQCETEACRDFQQKMIESLEEDKERLEEEKDYKATLRWKLERLAEAIKKIEEPATKLAALPDQCQTNVQEKCSGSCEGGGHDTLGCFPVGCNGGNPCPMEELKALAEETSLIVLEIKQIAEEIINEIIPGPPDRLSHRPALLLAGYVLKKVNLAQKIIPLLTNFPAQKKNNAVCQKKKLFATVTTLRL